MGIGRVIAGALGGIVLAGGIIFLSEAAGHSLVRGDAVFGAVAIGHGLGAAAGSYLACRIAGRRASIAVPVILALLALANILSFVHPTWFAPLAAVLLVAGWVVGAGLSRRRETGG